MTELRFLWEVGVEEIPSRYLAEVTRELYGRMTEALAAERIGAGPLQADSTPRRLVVYGSVRAEQDPKWTIVRGPRLEAAYRNGAPTPALEGFLRRSGVPVDELTEETIDGKPYLVARRREAEESAAVVLPRAASKAFLAMNLPRSMRWGSGQWRFVRPVRWTGLWLENQALTFTIAGVASGSLSYGNRTDHPGALVVESAEAYPRLMESVLKVILNQDQRREAIVAKGRALAEGSGGEMAADDALLDEVAALVEWPVPFRGAFDPEFLTVPEPILVTAMKVHQRYFPMYNPSGGLLPYFIGVRNGEGKDLDTVRHGNEKVLRARLKDADYFYRQDISQPLATRIPRLAQVVFHAKLGTYADKIERMMKLWEETRSLWSLDATEASAVLRAIQLLKCDLLTHVVEEFPELEGVMGGIYAKHDGESDIVADAIMDQYLPRWQGDRIPKNRVGAVIGLLDRTDTLVMSWAHDIQPTGSEDPFGLRRAALGIARIGTESDVAPGLRLITLLETAKALYGLDRLDLIGLRDLVISRLKSFWADKSQVEAVDALLAKDDVLGTLASRVSEWKQVADSAGWNAYLAGFKRIDRVVRDWNQSHLEPFYGDPQEERLAAATRQAAAASQRGVSSWWAAMPNVLDGLTELFERVLVMDADLTVRSRRLSLLAACRQELARFWDPSRFSAQDSQKG